MNALVDTNIFLEIFLDQSASRTCRNFLENDLEAVRISDFSLHSIGVLLFRQRRFDLFERFVRDMLPKLAVLTLSNSGYFGIVKVHDELGLDFDDAYQFVVAKENNLAIATRDRDFERVRDEIVVRFV